MKNVALVLTGLAFGVLAGVAFVPRVLAQAQPAPPVVRWQQYCEPAASIPEASGLAGARGADGWELVTYGGGAVCFKRRAPARTGDASNWPGY
jgi:hypothetical protein